MMDNPMNETGLEEVERELRAQGRVSECRCSYIGCPNFSVALFGVVAEARELLALAEKMNLRVSRRWAIEAAASVNSEIKKMVDGSGAMTSTRWFTLCQEHLAKSQHPDGGQLEDQDVWIQPGHEKTWETLRGLLQS